MHTLCSLDVNFSITIWTFSCKRRCFCLRFFTNRHQLVNSLHQKENNKCHNNKINNCCQKRTIFNILSGMENLKMTANLRSANTVYNRINKAFCKGSYNALKRSDYDGCMGNGLRGRIPDAGYAYQDAPAEAWRRGQYDKDCSECWL